MTSAARTSATRRLAASSIVTVLVTLLALVSAAVMFVSASQEAAASRADGVFPRGLLGIVFLDGFRAGSHFGVHLYWACWLFLIVPVLVGIGTSIPGVKAFLRARD